MRVGLIASTAGHLAVLLWGVVSFPNAKPFDVPPVDSLPVDLVPISELTKLRIGEKDAEVREVEATKPVKPKTPEVKPETPPVQAKTETPTPTPTPEPAKQPAKQAAKQPAAAPEPEPAPPTPPRPAEPVKAPEPAPAPAPKEAVAEAPKEKAPEPAEKKVAEAPKPVPSVRPRTKPTPPPKATKKKKAFNPNQIAALLNKVDPAGGGTPSASENPASLGSRKGLSNVSMSQSELDALRSQISQCWNPPAGSAGANDLNVRLKVYLRPDGGVDMQPEVLNSSSNPSFTIAAESARRAVLRCAPYSLPAAKYDAWREVIINFDPRDLLGG
ncbi:cell envelope biogenesis protein TolA [Stappia taiwanensis]|uniref:Cell envelope biogenesis protein TolA n=1 Tax=Stappia taiwanensis TaxID=992267 RepID=A0A838XP75_9HYPH|nr:cell envelope biogenesis protein TolA [Stappia taiwanensis]MBA4612285.1 cell envelope biogenesis protein TolA [Stappia taiwanensis]GGF04222.1 hypothetical protein GCM10007285_35000 [Stappia taiwanensis]